VSGAGKGKRPRKIMLSRLLAMAAHALAEVSFMKSSNAICVFTIS
jgi:hypothetical protein